jgi:hypothetical protein
MALARRKVCKRHFERATDFRVQVMNSAGKAIRRKPFCHGISVEEGSIDSLRRRLQDTVKADSIWHECWSFLDVTLMIFQIGFLGTAERCGDFCFKCSCFERF